MFRLTVTNRFKWPVTVRKPSETTSGEVEEQSFVGLFRVLPRSEAVALAEEMRAADTVEKISAAEMGQIAAVLEGWEDVVDEVGCPLAFAPAILLEACEWAWFRDAVVKAYLDGVGGARLGN